ncbi:MAG: carboxypeptidase-like regulatory domain-containing protein [Lutibacter sp.]|nr:carboxypeptidase-like regulatory domain-containing protein [Lutibacter sp.]MDT8416355.1 carboxypeptidase-like regulatory domain-containing protein [Lutibacter sp.]
MLHKTLYTALFILSLQGFSQEIKDTDTLKQRSILVTLRGQIIDNASKLPLSGAHLFNLNSVIGTISNEDGMFGLATTANDTIYVSYVGYQSIKLKITNDLLKGNELVIELYERTEKLDEIVVNSHKLIGVLEIDAKNVPKDKYSRIHINGVPQTYEVGTRRRKEFNSPIDALFRPIDFVYNMFGENPNQLRKLKKLKDDDTLRNMLDTSDRELLMEYLGMTAEELNELLNECNYSDYFIKSASDLQLIEAVLLCYENHKAIKKGSTIKEK